MTWVGKSITQEARRDAEAGGKATSAQIMKAYLDRIAAYDKGSARGSTPSSRSIRNAMGGGPPAPTNCGPTGDTAPAARDPESRAKDIYDTTENADHGRQPSCSKTTSLKRTRFLVRSA